MDLSDLKYYSTRDGIVKFIISAVQAHPDSPIESLAVILADMILKQRELEEKLKDHGHRSLVTF